MFSTPELILIFVVALVVVGPKKLPEVAKTLGKGLGELKRSLDDVKGQVQSEFNEIKDSSGIKEAFKDGAELRKSLQDMAEQASADIQKSIDSSVVKPSASAIESIKNISEPPEAKVKE